jgi:hypothetical protein
MKHELIIYLNEISIQFLVLWQVGGKVLAVSGILNVFEGGDPLCGNCRTAKLERSSSTQIIDDLTYTGNNITVKVQERERAQRLTERVKEST